MNHVAPQVVPISDPIYLHWQLLPYDPARCKKRLLFDVSKGLWNMRDITRSPPLALGSSDLDKSAAKTSLTRMVIQCRQLPHWEIVVNKASGILCRDVYQAIHDSMCTRLTERERNLYVTDRRRDRIQAAFEERCRDSVDLDEVARRRGMMRVDLLEGARIFMGLVRPPDSDEYWLLNMGVPGEPLPSTPGRH